MVCTPEYPQISGLCMILPMGSFTGPRGLLETILSTPSTVRITFPTVIMRLASEGMPRLPPRRPKSVPKELISPVNTDISITWFIVPP